MQIEHRGILCAILAVVMATATSPAVLTVFEFIATGVVWGLLEYLLHAQVHRDITAYVETNHKKHHGAPDDPALAVVSNGAFATGLIVLLLPTMVFELMAPRIGMYLLAWYVFYELFHLCLHTVGTPFTHAKEWHKSHHGHPKTAHGVTTFTWDLLFKTAPADWTIEWAYYPLGFIPIVGWMFVQ
jgi:hypothetical protein